MSVGASEKRNHAGYGGYVGLDTAAIIEVMGVRENCRYSAGVMTVEVDGGLRQIYNLKVADD